ncbi:MAG: hypothetical protein H7222_14095 [Methylotenera sp.]|nr:hypothetical protein [Oligoflexia bacterium]
MDTDQLSAQLGVDAIWREAEKRFGEENLGFSGRSRFLPARIRSCWIRLNSRTRTRPELSARR